MLIHPISILSNDSGIQQLVCILLFLIIPFVGKGQSNDFANTVFEIPIGPSVCVADLNGDSFEDIIVSGKMRDGNSSTYHTRVYLNTGNGSFTFTGQELFGFIKANFSPGDFDNDNDIDLIISGRYYNESGLYSSYSILYRNDGEANFSSVINDYFPNNQAAVYQWGDSDMDGDQDIFTIGGSYQEAKILSNNNGNFTEKETGIPGMQNCNAKWADYDNDGDLDLLVSGSDSIANKYIIVYKNVDNVYSRKNLDFNYGLTGRSDWGDYDNDGDLDFLVTGSSGFYIFRNQGNDLFTLVSTHNLKDLFGGVVKWGDYDLDGNLDILACGEWLEYDWVLPTSRYLAAVFKNVGSNNFEQIDITTDIAYNTGVEWIDYDNDDDLDVLITEDYSIRLVENSHLTQSNNPPSLPSNLIAEQRGTSLVLSWDPSIDDVSSDSTIQYNIWIGTDSVQEYLIAPMSDLSTGFPMIRKHGNALFANEKVIHNVRPGEYYWGVQAIDNSGLASGFSNFSDFAVMKPHFSQAIVDSVLLYSENTSSVCWGDYNNDGYLDAFSNGRIYTHEEGRLVYTHTLRSLENVKHAKWVDYDNDGDLDISFCGYSTNTTYPRGEFHVYENDNNSFYRDNLIQNDRIAQGGFCWRDFNSDGLKDLIISGISFFGDFDLEEMGVTKYYQNSKDSGLIESPFPVAADSYFSNGVYSEDLDSDSDFDIVFKGNGTTCINDGDGVFKIVDKGIDYSNGVFAFGDYDNDKDIDILTAGSEPSGNNRTMILLNTDGEYSNALVDLPGFNDVVSLNWVDVDGDHDLDIFMAGLSRIFHVKNLGEDDHEVEVINNFPIGYCNIEAGDSDNDGDVDLLISNDVNGSIYIGVCQNNYSDKRASSKVPQHLKTDMDRFDVILSWEDPLWDSIYPVAYSYDIKVGTAPGLCDIVAPDSDPETGFIRTMHRGNASVNNKWRLKNLPLGKYYWSVLAINQGYQTSEWAPMGTFTIAEVSPDFNFDTVCYGFATSFTDLSVTTGEISAWKWDFGDGGLSDLKDPTYEFASAGIHHVTLWGYTQSGDSASVTKEVLVLDMPHPIFSADPVCDREKVMFTDLSYIKNPQEISYYWNFGDGANSTSKTSVSHLYSNPGTYTASLTISSTKGCLNQRSRQVVVAESPEAEISLAKGYTSDFCVGDSTLLLVPGNPVNTYQWQLNDEDIFGETDSSLVVRGEGGGYKVVVKNLIAGCISSDSIQVAVTSRPDIPEILTENYVPGNCPGEIPITLKVMTIDPGILYQWKRNGIAIEGAINSAYTAFLDEAEYSLEASNGSCGVESEALTIEYGDMPDKPDIIPRGPEVWYLVCSNDSADVYRWYKDGELIDGAESHLYVAGRQEGEFEVSISDDGSCFAWSDPIWIPFVAGINTDPFADLKIYPNPTQGLFTLEMDNPVMGELVIDIFTGSGKKIINIKFHKETSHFRTDIDLSEQPAAVYLINLMLEENKVKRTLIVE